MLTDLMEERRWRIPQLADALGISVDIVRRWQQGKSRMQIDDLVAVAKLKGADLNEVFGLKPSAVKGGGDVEELIDSKIEKVLGKIIMAMAGAVSEARESGSSSDAGPAPGDSAAPQRTRRRRA
jgi:transcriptional regulator with XRE-family HTH domain